MSEIPAGSAAPARAAWWLRALAHLPLAVLHRLGGALAWLARPFLRRRRQIARDNLARCFPALSVAERERILRRSWRGTADVAMETLKLATISAAQLRARVICENLPLVQAQIAQGRSVVLLAAHYANWEWMLQVLTLELGCTLNAAYKPLHNARADRQLYALRSRFGAQLIGAKRLLREIARMRDRAQAVAIMADQVPTSSATRHWLEFLGRETAFYPGPAQIVGRTGFAAFFVAIRRVRRGHYRARFEPLSTAGESPEPYAFTQRYARCIEAQILEQPADWMWTHRRWKLIRDASEPLRR